MIACLIVAGCQRPNQFVPPPPPQVSIAQPLVREIPEALEFVGNTRSTASVELRARVNGYLKKILFEDGASVKQGDLLFVIEQAPFQSAVDIAHAELQRAEAELLWQRTEYERIKPLVNQQPAIVTQAELDEQAAKLATAKANVAAAQAALRRAELELGYAEIRAPLTGRIGRHLVDAGNLIQAEQTLLSRIESIDPIHAYFSISEPDLLRVMEMHQAGKIADPNVSRPPLFLGLANEEGFPRRGYLDYLELGLDPRMGTAVWRGVFANSNDEVLPGMFVRIRAPIGQPVSRLLIEKRAVGTDQRGDFVFVVNDKNQVEYRLVKLGASTGGMRIVEDGLKPEEWILVNGLQRARPGATVAPERIAMAMAPSAEAESAPVRTAARDGSAPNGVSHGPLPSHSDANASPPTNAASPASSQNARSQ